jgi:GT2 family glycosyltransferase
MLVAPNESFIYGGAFIPMKAVREAPLPDKDLVLYGDDIEYSWGIKRLGYASYVCYSPKIYDIDMSFGDGSQSVGLFDPSSAYFKIYFRIRNMVRISVRNTKQWQCTLFLNISIWVTALSLLGLVRYGISRDYVIRLRLILHAVYAGYILTTEVPVVAKLP